MMGLVCMSLEEMERPVSRGGTVIAFQSPGGDVSGYMIYYQTEGGPVISDKVSGGERETNSLDGLQRGVTYYISILALSQHLPSPLVGPVSDNTSKSNML